jgi:hypothetical protein
MELGELPPHTLKMRGLYAYIVVPKRHGLDFLY